MSAGKSRSDQLATDEDVLGLVSLNSPTEERNPRTVDIDVLSTLDLVALINDEDGAVMTAVEGVRETLANTVDAAVETITAGGRVHYFGAGTSGRLGVLDAVELLPTYAVGTEWFEAHIAGGVDAMFRAAEGIEDRPESGRVDAADVRRGDLVIGIAASGRTPYVAGAFDVADERGARTALVSSNPFAELAPRVEFAILLDTGPEVITGSTRMKAATAQKIVLNTFSTATMIKLGKTYSNLMIDVLPTNKKLRARIIRLLVQATGIEPGRCEGILIQADGDIKVALLVLLQERDAQPMRPADATIVDRVSTARDALKRSGGIIRNAKALLDAETTQDSIEAQ
ncbi:N-acetylmuramic acid 6-phosphate etherase [Lysinibacter cavernae]|uniref:N-acetylmuramic acid 6-phosphate etherase n=1 Tax=Lysinibacter cavernae TaxID=1640652 RepID=A0A7X5R1T5_9MICO|nr:N-acetylmuramic acid 6-phosphate etherase [Lysinibacter cavernae]NIH54043.1 N-acetylmuramic acid 6-phosphate etherase [Lysinibacter cavernae]